MKENRIPKEIADFFESGGASLIIKGPPGAGKTTLALEIAYTMKENFRTIYESTRSSEVNALRRYPWVEEILNVKKKDENTNSVTRDALNSLEGYIEEGGEEVTATVSNSEVVFEYDTILPELDRIYDEIDNNAPDKSLVIMDSIDGMAERYGIPALKLMQTLQDDLVEKSGVRLIVIIEGKGENIMDYFGDGVVSLEYQYMDGLLLRTLTIQKLRGCAIENPKYPFTLNDGRFTAFGKLHDIPEPVVINNGLYSTGYTNIDRTIGCFDRGEVTLIKFGNGTESKLLMSIMKGLITNIASRGQKVFVVECASKKLDFATKNVVCASGSSDADVYLEGKDLLQELSLSTIEYHLKEGNEPHTVIMWLDTLHILYGNTMQLNTLLKTLTMKGYTILLLTHKAIPMNETLEYTTKKVIELTSVNNVPLIHIKRPPAGMYGVLVDDKKLKVVPVR